jgi:hypothetical protein
MLKTALPIFLTVLYATGLLFAGILSKKFNVTFSTNGYVDIQLKYQLLLLSITAISLVTTFLLNKQNFSSFFSWGDITATGEQLKLFGIKKGDSWLKNGCFTGYSNHGCNCHFYVFSTKADQYKLGGIADRYFMDNTFFAYKFIW